MKTKGDGPSTHEPPASRPELRESPITVKLSNASKAWDEFVAVPSTPSPWTVPSNHSGGQVRKPKRRGLLVLTAAVVLGLGLGLGALLHRKHAPQEFPTRPKADLPVELPKEPAALVRTPPPPPPAAPTTSSQQGDEEQREVRPAKVERTAPPAKRDRRFAEVNPAKSSPAKSSPATLTVAPEKVPAAKPAAPVEEFGMDLKHPSTKRQIKPMDEKDPYSQ